MSVCVPTILKYLNTNNDINIMGVDQNVSAPTRAKKRRLDHLSWEEKMQRKKLKNRVAAQTSRDRKKAKMEQMEAAIQDLFTRNETLLTECENLRLQNKKLTEENAELHDKLKAPCSKCLQNRSVECDVQQGSTAEAEQTLSSGFESTGAGVSLEDCPGLPSLPDLLDELNTDVDLNSLEQLTQSLLQDIARDMEIASEKANTQESKVSKSNGATEVVGTTPEQLESSGGEGLKQENTLEKEISPYILLHHDYVAKPKPNTERSTTKAQKRKTVIKKPKAIRPKIDVPNTTDVIYGTYDEKTNCLTIIINDENSADLSNLSEMVTVENSSEITKDSLTVPAFTRDSSSPALKSDSSDCGYESFGSPQSFGEGDMGYWDESMTELFPSLI